MKQGLTEVICIIDKSGSMAHLTGSTIENYNSFMRKQREFPGEVRSTLVLFNANVGNFNNWLNKGLYNYNNYNYSNNLAWFQQNDWYRILDDNVNIHHATQLNRENYRPDGGTALYDAVGHTIDRIGQRLANTLEENRPSKVVVVILTDGEE